MTKQNTSKSVLLISNRVPSDSGGRAGKVATRKRLLAERGWNVVVGHAPEPYISGAPRALRQCIQIGRQQDVDAVLSINNPFHLHILGYFASRTLDTPWLAELRDPIFSHPDRDPKSPITWGAKVAEHLVVNKADRIVWFDGIQISDDYFDRYRRDPEDIIKLPPMGYEKAAFDAAGQRDYSDFTITYAGSFYEGWIEPYTFLDGLGVYADQYSTEALQVQFYGDWNESYEQATTKAGVSDFVNVHNFIPHKEIVPVLKGSDVLLYIGGTESSNRLNLPSKIWDYIGAQRPILAVVNPSFRVAEFIRHHDLGIVADATDPRSVADALHTLRNEYEFKPDREVIHGYTRERSADRIAELLNDLISE